MTSLVSLACSRRTKSFLFDAREKKGYKGTMPQFIHFLVEYYKESCSTYHTEIYEIYPVRVGWSKDTNVYAWAEDIQFLYEIGVGFQSMEDCLLSLLLTVQVEHGMDLMPCSTIKLLQACIVPYRLGKDE